MRPLVSIITPTYRADHAELWRCLTSVQRQSYDNFEQIVVSDGPREHGTEQIVRSFGDARLRYFCTGRHFGVSGNGVRHEAMMTHAAGRYLVFLDDDNIVFPRYLEKMMAALTGAEPARDVRAAFCEILHFGPVQAEIGVPPLVLAAVPKLHWIDTLQLMVEAETMRAIGWNSDELFADGVKYEQLARQHAYVVVPEVLCAHL